MTVKPWSLGTHGQCIDIVSDLHDTFIGDVGKYKFTCEVKRIDIISVKQKPLSI